MCGGWTDPAERVCEEIEFEGEKLSGAMLGICTKSGMAGRKGLRVEQLTVIDTRLFEKVDPPIKKVGAKISNMVRASDAKT